jgi:benzylsuccinate CoA-transferase BbsF subunit
VNKRPLEGIRVAEFTTSWVGPEAGFTLSQMGAEVIKVENPTTPDYWRRICNAYQEGKGLNRSGAFASINRGKKSLVLDLKKAEELEIARRLVKASDIVISNFAPGVMVRLGLGYEELKKVKPDIIAVFASGYGASGPDKQAVAFGPVLEPYSGISLFIGKPEDPPLSCGVTITDHLGAITVALAAMIALYHRDLTGEGQFVDVSEIEALLTTMPEPIMDYVMNGREYPRLGNRDEVMVPHGCYRCRGDDKWVAIAVGNDSEWRALCQALGKPELAEDERFRDGYCRMKHQDELDSIISDWTRDMTPTEAMTRLQEAGIAAGPAYSSEELFSEPHLRARNFFVEHTHPEVGKKELHGVFARFTETPLAIDGSDPLFGEHNERVLNELLSPE